MKHDAVEKNVTYPGPGSLGRFLPPWADRAGLAGRVPIPGWFPSGTPRGGLGCRSDERV